MFESLMEAVRVRQADSGQVRTRPERAMADKAYSSKAIRQYLRDHGIQCVIPEKEDQIANRKRKGSAGGRPVRYDKEAYKRRNESGPLLQHHEAMAIPGHPLRQAGPHLPLADCCPASSFHLERRIRRHALADP